MISSSHFSTSSSASHTIKRQYNERGACNCTKQMCQEPRQGAIASPHIQPCIRITADSLETTVDNEGSEEWRWRSFVHGHLQLGESMERPDPAMGLALAETPPLLHSEFDTHSTATCCVNILWDWFEHLSDVGHTFMSMPVGFLLVHRE